MKSTGSAVARLLHRIFAWLVVSLLVMVLAGYYILGYFVLVPSDYIPNFWELQLFEVGHNINGTFLIGPIFLTCIVFGWKRFWMLWLGAVGVAFMPYLVRFTYSTWQFGTNLLFLSIIPIIGTIIRMDMDQRARQKVMLAQRETERQSYMAEMFKQQEDDRQHVAQELHDHVVQNLLVIANRLQPLASQQDGTEAKEAAGWAVREVLASCEDLRRISLNLSPPILDGRGLVPALAWLVEGMNQEHGIKTEMTVVGEIPQLPEPTEVALFRVVQEALTNVRRHSQATQAMVALKVDEAWLEIAVKDNGVGMDPPQHYADLTRTRKLGMAGMYQRAKSINGTFRVDSRKGEGTTVLVRLKLYSANPMYRPDA